MELKNMTEIYRKKDKVFYRDGNKLIKLFEGNYPKENILNEALNQARVERTTLHIPRIEAVTSVEGKWAIVMEYIEGETLAALMKKNPSKEEEYLGTLAELQTEISTQRVPLLPRLKDKMYEKISASEYSDTVKYDLQTRLDGLPKHYKLCHGDFRPSNVIVRGDGTFYIVDWAHATQGNAAADAARTYLIFRLCGETSRAETYCACIAKRRAPPAPMWNGFFPSWRRRRRREAPKRKRSCSAVGLKWWIGSKCERNGNVF